MSDRETRDWWIENYRQAMLRVQGTYLTYREGERAYWQAYRSRRDQKKEPS